jgi:hypothetical protein
LTFDKPNPVATQGHLRVTPRSTSKDHRWIEANATVMTFNYDMLVESAFLHVTAGEGSRPIESLYAIPLTSALSRSGVGLWGGDLPREFDLLKLHGSLNWYYSGLDAPNNDTVSVGGGGTGSRSG